MLYLWLKLFHILAAIVWLGGALTLAVAFFAYLRAGDRAATLRFGSIVRALGPRLVGAASGITLLSGIAVAWSGHLFRAAWVQLGFIGFVLHAVVGGVLIERARRGVEKALTDGVGSDAVTGAAVGRLRNVYLLYLFLMLAVVGVMVLKPQW
jgi:uncharacterized membrane protein